MSATKHNHLAIAVAVILNFVVGGMWYSPMLFQGSWLSGWHKRPEEVNQQDPALLLVGLPLAIASAYILSWLIQKTNMQTATGGALLAALTWLAASAPALMPHYALAGVGWSATFIDSANALVCSMIAGAIIGGWRRRA